MEKTKESREILSEAFVKDTYNTGLRKLEEPYTDRRWFSSVESKFDYNQTKYAFLKAFGNGHHNKGLEVGPGDGVWTKEIASQFDSLELLDQSEEMLKRAKGILADFPHLSYTQANFAEHELTPSEYDFILSVRCFEYITDKKKAIEKFFKALKPGGKFVLITKNPNYRNQSGWKKPLLHTEQIAKDDLIALLKQQGFVIDAVYPAVMRWKSKYFFFRMLFAFLHKIAVLTRGRIYVPWLTDMSTESYTYVVHKDKMLVEMYGLSGSGKSTLARELKDKDPIVTLVGTEGKRMGLVYFIFNNPTLFFFWIKEMILLAFVHNDWTLFRHRFSILMSTFGMVGNAQRIKKGIVVLDEGLFQRVFSIYEKERSPEELIRLIRYIPPINLLVMMDRGDAGNFVRFYNHKQNPRMQLGEGYMEAWKKIIFNNHKSLKEAVAKIKVPTFLFQKEHTAEQLLLRLKSL